MNADEHFDLLIPMLARALSDAPFVLIVCSHVAGDIAALRIGASCAPEVARELIEHAMLATRDTPKHVAPPVRMPQLEPELKPKP